MSEKIKESNFKLIGTGFSGLYIVEVFSRSDERGSFEKDYCKFIRDELNLELKEVFYTRSQKNVIRANHFQIIKPQAKFIRCISGSIIDVVVDMRKHSSTYMKYFKIELNANSMRALFIPVGFSHGYFVKEDAIVSYKCDEDFLQEGDTGFKWNDEDIKIDWEIPLGVKAILSEKDNHLPSFKDIADTLDF